MPEQSRVVLLSLDSVNPRGVTEDLMPNLWALAQGGGWASEGGYTDLPSVTYPSHATLITGRKAVDHGVRSNLSAKPRDGAIPGWAGNPAVVTPTLFDACNAAGLSSAAVVGDQHLWTLLRAGEATVNWPPDGKVQPGTPVDPFGYQLDSATIVPLLEAVADPTIDFVFGHLNEPDTWGHLTGPDSERTQTCYRATDAMIGQVIDALQPDWNRTALIVVSDHGMEMLPINPPIDLRTHPATADLFVDVIDEGGASLARLAPGVTQAQAGAAVAAIDGIAAWVPGGPEDIIVHAEAGVFLGATAPHKFVMAGHGGIETIRTVAVIGGGHPWLPRVGEAIAANPPHLAEWADIICSLLDVTPPSDLPVG